METRMDSNSPKDVSDLFWRLRQAGSRLAWKLGKKNVTNPPTLVVISPGGVASTLLISELSKFVQTNSSGDSDGIKHLAQRPQNVEKVILLTGDAGTVTKSLSRRGYLGLHHAKMGNPLGVIMSGRLQEAMFRRAVRKQRRHFANAGGSTLVVDYEEMWGHLPAIADFAGIDSELFVRGFPPQNERRQL